MFDFLRSLVKENGLLIIQTPNAVSLSKRFIIARGENPYELIRENMREDPGHYREYTRNELCHFGYQAGFDVLDTFMVNYFREEANLHGRLDRISRYLPENFRTGMTIIYKKRILPDENVSGNQT